MAQSEDGHERAWVELARGGDAGAIGWLYERYSDRIYSYAYARLGNPTEAEDITEQVFLKVMESLSRFEWKGSSFAAWLFTIAHNLAIDTLRKQSRYRHVPIDAVDAPSSSEDADPQRYAERSDFLEQVREAMSQLTDLQAQVVALKYGAGLRNAEVAEIMSRSPNAVNALHYEALKKLQKLLTQKGYIP